MSSPFDSTSPSPTALRLGLPVRGDRALGEVALAGVIVLMAGVAAVAWLGLRSPASGVEARQDAGWTLPGGVCVGGLVAIGAFYRRARQRVAGLDILHSGLLAIARGETALPALLVDDRFGADAAAWNKLMHEVDSLRRRSQTASSASANSRRGGGNLESACDAMSQGILLLDDKLCVRYANGAACALLGLDRATVHGKGASELIADEKFQTAVDNIGTGNQRRPQMIELQQPNDGVLRVNVRPVRRGDPDSAMIVVEDVTQQRMAEKARNQFINQVTHELRTPLTNIRLYAETAIDDDGADTETRAKCLNVINQESRRLERIVTEMLSVAEIEAGSMAVRSEEVYADVLMKELEHDYTAQAADKNIKLVFNISPKLPKLTADKDKLAIALHNLIGNALKYTPEGGSVTVGVDVRDGQLAVDVIDTGIGIEPAEQEKVFDRFFRSGDPRVGKIVGTGLGLTLAREVMRLHGGDVTLKSEINRGSTFTATLPVAMAA